MIKFFIKLLIIVIVFKGCGTSDGSTTSSSGVDPLDDVIGYLLTQTVIDGETNGTGVISKKDDIVKYTFLTSTKVLGAGLNVLDTSSWTYSRSGNKGTISLYYGTIGESVEELTYTSSNEGTYISTTELYGSGSITTVWGTFVINESDYQIIEDDGVEYSTITSPYTDKIWLDRNLGASRACTSYTDNQCFGDYYQWGRERDGHEKRTSTVVTTAETSITTTSSSFVYLDYSDWTNIDEDGTQRSFAWSKIDGSSICPIGFRVPTINELINETEDVSNVTEAFQNFLKLPSAGYRGDQSGGDEIIGYYRGTQSHFWASDVGNGATSYKRHFNTATVPVANFSMDSRYRGSSVRCIKD